MDQDNKETAVEWLINQYIKDGLFLQGVYERAKQMEADLARKYAEFCVLSDRQGMRLLEFNDFVKQLNK